MGSMIALSPIYPPDSDACRNAKPSSRPETPHQPPGLGSKPIRRGQGDTVEKAIPTTRAQQTSPPLKRGRSVKERADGDRSCSPIKWSGRKGGSVSQFNRDHDKGVTGYVMRTGSIGLVPEVSDGPL
jgi:hypothetical protein